MKEVCSNHRHISTGAQKGQTRAVEANGVKLDAVCIKLIHATKLYTLHL